MKLLIVGVSYRTAPVTVLERLSVPTGAAPQLLDALLSQEYVGEALVLSTCNRVEVYAGVTAFHGGLADIGAVLAARAGYSQNELAEYLYVHYDADAVHHAYRVATGLDSMVVGEAQVLGQLRDAYGRAVEQDAVGTLVHELMQQALRVGKRAHAETGIDRAGQNVVSTALSLAGPVAGRPALVNGAGSMGGLALAALRRAGADPLYVTSRSPDRAARLAQLHGAVPVPELDLSTVDLVVTATASVGHVIDTGHVRGPVTILDLAVPRDVDPAVRQLPGVRVIDIAQVGDAVRSGAGSGGSAAASAALADREQVERLVAGEVAAFMAWLRSADVAPTVAALRARADEVVAAELRRLAQRQPELSEQQRAEVARTVHRVVQRLLHQPTVRVRRLAAEPGGDRYTQLLRELFDLEVPEPGSVAEIPEVS
ncbi:MAG: glutamyl-tRNA reductase [Micromonosporaceae bacterium]|nr:glutamyl-tRNA reductase [Micromonosporaceae bacterium]